MNSPTPGLYPNFFSVDNANFIGNDYGLDAGSDSFYEYLLKMWLSTNDHQFKIMYDQFTRAAQKVLVQRSADGRHVWTPFRDRKNKFHHLVRFMTDVELFCRWNVRTWSAI